MTTMPQIYTVLVHQAEEGGYWAELLELPGCVSQGETLEELKRNIREAMEAVLEQDTKNIDLTLVEPGETYQWSSSRTKTWTSTGTAE